MQQTLETLSIRVDKLEHDTNELFERTNTSAIAQATISEKLNSMLVTLGELKAGLSTLQQRPGKWWDFIIGSIITALTAGLIGLIVFKK